MRNIDWAQAYQDVQEQRRPTGAQRRERQRATRAEREADTSRTGIQRASDIISGRSREEGNAIRDKARADQQAQSSQLRQRTVSDLATGAKNALEAGAQAVGGAAKNVERKRLGGLGKKYLRENQMTATAMGENFIKSMNGAFENWKPRIRYTMEKV